MMIARLPTSEYPGLKMFKTVEPDSVKAVSTGDDWEEIEFALDSGATETVLGEDMLNSVQQCVCFAASLPSADSISRITQ